MNTNNNNINVTDEEFFALHPQPPLTSSGYPLHFPSRIEVENVSSSSNEEEEDQEEEEETGNNNYTLYSNYAGCCTTTGNESDEEEDLALYERKRCFKRINEDIPMDISDSESEKEEEEEDIPMDISDSESDDEPMADRLTLRRSNEYDERYEIRPRRLFQELEEGEIDESDLFQSGIATNSAPIEAVVLDLNEYIECEDDLADLPDLVPIHYLPDNVQQKM